MPTKGAEEGIDHLEIAVADGGTSHEVGNIDWFRRCMRDYETLPEHDAAMVHTVTIMTMS